MAKVVSLKICWLNMNLAAAAAAASLIIFSFKIPKLVTADFPSSSTINIQTLATGSWDSQVPPEGDIPNLPVSVKPILTYINQNWGIVSWDESQVIDHQIPSNYQEQIWFWSESYSDYVLGTNCHTELDLNQDYLTIQSEDPENCFLVTGSSLAVPIDTSIFVKRDGLMTRLIPEHTVATLPGDLRLTEVMWAGSYRGDQSLASDEWLEIYNTTPQTIKLGGLQLVGAAAAGGTITIPDQYYIASHSFFVVGRRANANTQLNKNPDWVTTSLSLANDSASISLTTGSGDIIDSLPGGAWQAGLNDTINHLRFSAQLKNLDAPSNDWSNWSQCSVDTFHLMPVPNFKTQQPVQNCGSPWGESVF